MDWGDLDRSERPFFVYCLDMIKGRVSHLRQRLDTIVSTPYKLYYGLKYNPHWPLVNQILSCVDGVEVGSYSELLFCLNRGVSPSRISISGPGKTDDALRLSIERRVGTIQIDSSCEFSVVNQIARDLPTQGIGFLRSMKHQRSSLELPLAPPTVSGMPTTVRANGLFVSLGNERISHDNLSVVLLAADGEVTRNRSQYTDAPIAFVRLHSGVGQGELGPQQKIETSAVAQFAFEAGRGIVTPAGFYAARVLSVRSLSNGLNQIIVNGGLHHLAGPLARVDSAHFGAQACLVRGGNIVETETAEYLVAGSLCLGNDFIHPRMTLPNSIRRGDWVIFSNVGAYGMTASTPFFIGQDLPREFVLCGGAIAESTRTSFRPYHECF